MSAEETTTEASPNSGASTTLLGDVPKPAPEASPEGSTPAWDAELKNDPAFASRQAANNWNGPLDIFKGYVELESVKGIDASKLMPRPVAGEPLTDELRGILGVKTGTDNYANLKIGGVNWGAKISADGNKPEAINAHQNFNDLCRKVGVTAAGAQVLLDSTIEEANKLYDSESKQNEIEKEATEKLLKDEWGAEYKDKWSRISLSKEYITGTEVGKAFLDSLEASGFGNSPAVLRYLSEFGEVLKEGRMIRGVSGIVAEMTKEDAQVVFDKFLTDTAFAKEVDQGGPAAIQYDHARKLLGMPPRDDAVIK